MLPFWRTNLIFQNGYRALNTCLEWDPYDLQLVPLLAHRIFLQWNWERFIFQVPASSAVKVVLDLSSKWHLYWQCAGGCRQVGMKRANHQTADLRRIVVLFVKELWDPTAQGPSARRKSLEMPQLARTSRLFDWDPADAVWDKLVCMVDSMWDELVLMSLIDVALRTFWWTSTTLNTKWPYSVWSSEHHINFFFVDVPHNAVLPCRSVFENTFSALFQIWNKIIYLLMRWARHVSLKIGLIIWRQRWKIIRTVLCCVMCDNDI